MPTLQVTLNPAAKTVQVDIDGTALISGYTKVGTFKHPDDTYPDSKVIYQGVRDVLYHTSTTRPPTTGAKFPNNITDMAGLAIKTANAGLAIPLYFTDGGQTFQTVNVGNNIKFAVQVGGGKTPYTYAWYFRTGPMGDYVAIDAAINPSAHTATLTNNAVTVESSGDYKVIVTDALGMKLDQVTTVEVTENYPTISQNVPVPPAPALTSITATPSTVALSVATDAAAGKTVAFAPVPSGAALGTLTIKTAPASARATATIAANVLTVKPVAAGAATTVVLTNGTIDVTVNVTVAA